MKVTLSFEESSSGDVSIMVDALRASTTITLALNSFKRIIPCFTHFETSEDTLIFTSTNGTRILENMNSKVLVGSMVNAKAVGLKSIELAGEHIDVVMAGVKGEFAIEDFLAAGEILYWISENLDDCELSEYAKAAILATRDYELVKDAFLNSRTAKRLIDLGYKDDIELSLLKNITDNVAIYHDNELTLYI